MPLEILQTTSTSAIIRKTLPDLSKETILTAVDALKVHTAWIVPLSVRDELFKLSGVIEDRGKKHPTIELARTLKTKNSLIPMIEGGYSSAGNLRQSLMKFLQRTGDGPPRLFIIAESEKCFSALCKIASNHLPVAVHTPISFAGKNGAMLNLMGLIPDPLALQEAFIGESTDAVVVRQFIMLAAQADDTVLITGDTGTGKEIVARQIHRNSIRENKPFQPVNCGAFPHDLLESELFGHVKGAFTGAHVSNQGLWISAGEGILFLDEIGELTPAHQAKLLRALQEKKIRPVGGTKDIVVKARIICATNCDLLNMVQAGQFRKDLYYRLREFLIITPPLRDHAEDIPLLAQTFWKSITQDEKAMLPNEIVQALSEYLWPGNVRELKMVLKHLFGLFRTAQSLDMRHLQAVFEIQGLPFRPVSNEVTLEELHPAGFSNFRRLRRVYETIRAIEHLLSNLLNPKKKNPPQSSQILTIVINLLHEIDMHSRTPRNLSPRTFDHLSLLRSRLNYFLSEHEKSLEKAMTYLQDGTHRIIEDAVANILLEIDQAIDGMV
jgi:DNA-binding NtrC family response regulator